VCLMSPSATSTDLCGGGDPAIRQFATALRPIEDAYAPRDDRMVRMRHHQTRYVPGGVGKGWGLATCGHGILQSIPAGKLRNNQKSIRLTWVGSGQVVSRGQLGISSTWLPPSTTRSVMAVLRRITIASGVIGHLQTAVCRTRLAMKPWPGELLRACHLLRYRHQLITYQSRRVILRYPGLPIQDGQVQDLYIAERVAELEMQPSRHRHRIGVQERLRRLRSVK